MSIYKDLCDAARLSDREVQHIRNEIHRRRINALTGGDTRLQAHEAIKPHLSRLCSQVLDAFVLCRDGLTDTELAKFTGLSENTARPRRRELVQRDRLRDSGLRRKTPSGRDAIVWVVA